MTAKAKVPKAPKLGKQGKLKIFKAHAFKNHAAVKPVHHVKKAKVKH